MLDQIIMKEAMTCLVEPKRTLTKYKPQEEQNFTWLHGATIANQIDSCPSANNGVRWFWHVYING